MERTVLHVDCNKFYASVECLHRPELRDKPVAVGGDEGVMTKAERDRARNIPAGMPTPVVHASALSVVVPTVGEAVRYQRLLLPAGATYEVEISAKEPLFARK